MFRPSSIEPLESRYAPALVIVNPLADLVASPGQTGTTVELGQMLDPFAQQAGHTLVKIYLNLDLDPNTAGVQTGASVTLELYDDETPLTVANFLRYAVPTANAAQAANDFVGTYFHRAVSGFVVQGGGFTTNANLTDHITTYSTVHNEFSPTRSNVRGTIAMAKVGLDDGGGPNSATSEWFVNLADNSGNLDSQNGGFTVFGQVIDGMTYIDQIAALQKVQFDGKPVTATSSSVPVQNYTPSATPVKPTTDQVVGITKIEVIKPQATNAAGQDFEVISITDPATGQPSDVVTTPTFNLSGTTLPLTYVTGKTGQADVTVRVTQLGETLDETFRVTVRPNLLASAAAEKLPNIIVPGDIVKPTVKLTNTGGGQFSGPVQVKFYLSPSTATDPQGRVINSEDIEIGSFPVQPVTVASDGSATLTGSLNINARLDRLEGAYRLIAEVIPQSGATTELFTDDNNAPDGNLHAYTNSFGVVSVAAAFGGQNFNFGTRVAKLSYTEADNNVVTFSLTGAGVGRVSANEGGVNLLVSGTNSASIVNLAAVISNTNLTAARASLHHLDFANTVGTINLAQADVDGYVTISSGVKVAKFGNITGNDRTLVLGSFGALNTTAATLNFARVTDLNIESDQNIAAINAVDWRDTAGAENFITTRSLTKLNIRGNAAAAVAGDFEADVTIQRGTALSSFAVKGFLRDATITVPGNVGTVKIGGMIDSNFFAGTTARPDALADFTAKRTIASFTLTGVPNGGSVLFADSQIAASTITAIALKGIDGTTGDSPFGVVADTVLSYTSGSTPRLNLTKPAVIDVKTNYSLTIL